MDAKSLWERYRQYLCVCEDLGLTLDISRMNFDDELFDRMAEAMDDAYIAMDRLESGAIANPDEKRMVGHYWLRAPQLAPTVAITQAVERVVRDIKTFAARIHSGEIYPPKAKRFTDLLLIGIGGSALGPEFVADALGEPAKDRLAVHFMDNTDPDGMDRLLASLADRLDRTICLVISKSGATAETRNGMIVAREIYEAAGLDFPKRAVAITGKGSALDKLAAQENWLARFEMWDWVGGRTSETSAVGLLPAALQGIDIDGLLAGAAACDAVTRRHNTPRNPAALLALMWFHATGGRGRKDMVVLPYKDRLLLFSRYLQQLVMESLGKALDLDGKEVEQGFAVYGNKGSTDQHAYIQQLREGVNNFFVTFIEVIADGGRPLEVESGVTCGDYLHGFLLGTRSALSDNGRESVTISIRHLDARSVGVLIALFERAVGFYATLVNINPYHQPGVEAGKKAAAHVLAIQRAVVEQLARAKSPMTAEQVARAFGKPEAVETVFKILEHLAANQRGVTRQAGTTFFDATFISSPRDLQSETQKLET
jgi:glucose-6-phosphate isomerase